MFHIRDIVNKGYDITDPCIYNKVSAPGTMGSKGKELD